MRGHRRSAAPAIAVALAGACAAIATAALPTDPPVWAPMGDPPSGSHRELCPRFALRDVPRTVSLILPDRYRAQDKYGGDCSFVADIDEGVTVTIAPHRTLADFKRRAVDPDLDSGGDDSVSDVEYQADTPVFGGRRGERLDYYAYNDGLPIDTRMIQADGLRVAWNVPHESWPKHEAAFNELTDSIGVLETVEDACVDVNAGIAIHFTPPALLRAVQSYSPVCNLRLPPLSDLTHNAAFATVSGGLRARRDKLAAARGVRRLRYRPRAAGYGDDGPAERLDYLVVKKRTLLRLVVLQRDGVRLTWSAKRARWPRDRAAFAQLRRSVQVQDLR